MRVLFGSVFLAVLAAVYASEYTVTEEVWFDFEVKNMDGPGEDYKGRVVIALFGEAAPMTVMNFAAITRGYERGKTKQVVGRLGKSIKESQEKLHYKGTTVHRIVPDFVLQMGDIVDGDGTGGRSIFGKLFNDEQFILSHRGAGWVAMANHGPDTNASQFYIMLTKARWLDGKHVVFGKVIRGMDVIETLGNVPSDPNTAVPKKEVRIKDCGQNELDKKYTLTEAQLKSEEDL